MTREQHLAWARKRALDYVDRGDLVQAIASLITDLGRHEETRSIGLEAIREAIRVAQSNDPQRARPHGSSPWAEGSRIEEFT